MSHFVAFSGAAIGDDFAKLCKEQRLESWNQRLTVRQVGPVPYDCVLRENFLRRRHMPW